MRREAIDVTREPRGEASLTDVLLAANMIVIHHGQPPEFLQARLQTVHHDNFASVAGFWR